MVILFQNTALQAFNAGYVKHNQDAETNKLNTHRMETVFICLTKDPISSRYRVLGLTYACLILKKVKVGNDQEKAQSEKDSHSKN